MEEELKRYMPGWKGYFQLAQTSRVFRERDEWLRHRLRALQIKHRPAGNSRPRRRHHRGDKILSAFTQPIEFAGQRIDTSTSISIAVYPVNGGDDAELLMKKGDIAIPPMPPQQCPSRRPASADFSSFLNDMNLL